MGGGAIPNVGNNAGGGAGANAAVDQAMQAAQQQMTDLLAKETTFSAQMESTKAGVNAAKSVTEPGVG
jgi:hypothetical protein